MTIHIDPNADIIQQLNDLSAILSVDEVNVSVSDEQLKAVKKHLGYTEFLTGELEWNDSGIGSKIVFNPHPEGRVRLTLPKHEMTFRIGALQFNLTTSQRIGTDPIHLTTSQHFSGNRIRFNEENKI